MFSFYRFCYPLNGGGIAGGPDDPLGDFSACNGVRPRPGCAPAFQRIAFRNPYSFDEPMAGDPLVQIDPNTGLITGSPQLIGQFVMAVCVEEYRDGELIGQISRDFQFNVADCDPTVFARVQSDAVVGDRVLGMRLEESVMEACNWR